MYMYMYMYSETPSWLMAFCASLVPPVPKRTLKARFSGAGGDETNSLCTSSNLDMGTRLAVISTRGLGTSPAVILTRGLGIRPAVILTRGLGTRLAVISTRGLGTRPAVILTRGLGTRPAVIMTVFHARTPLSHERAKTCIYVHDPPSMLGDKLLATLPDNYSDLVSTA